MAALVSPRLRATVFRALFALVILGAGLPAPSNAAVQTVAPSASIAVAQPTAESRVVQEAFDLIMDRFVQPVGSAELLTAGWERLAQDAAEAGAPEPGPVPLLTGARQYDVSTMREAVEGYVQRSVLLPDGFTPAYSVVRGMAALINEGHTYFLDPRQYQDYLDWASGNVRYGGIGARMRGPELTVTEVFEGSPAERFGLLPGDRILEVDGKTTSGVPLEQTVTMIRGPEGTFVELLIKRGDGEPYGVRVERAQITYDFVTTRMLEDNIGYVWLRGFPEPSVAERVEKAVAAMQEQGVTNLVLDLRGNAGGRIDVGTRLLSRFLPPGTNLFQQVERKGRQQTRSSRQATQFDVSLIVLVDSGTASMGEIFASAVQEQVGARVLGTTTAGSVAAAQVYPLGDGSALQLTVMEIVSSTGRPLNRVGVAPDEVIETPLGGPAGQDVLLDRAVEVFRASTLTPAS